MFWIVLYCSTKKTVFQKKSPKQINVSFNHFTHVRLSQINFLSLKVVSQPATYLISFSKGLMNGEPLIVCVLTI